MIKPVPKVLDEKRQYARVPLEVLLAWGLRLGLLSRTGGADSEQFRIDPTAATLLERADAGVEEPLINDPTRN